MENQKSIWFVTLLLSTVAGYSDTVTFVSAGSIFSAHVTGNFIVFAYQVIKGADTYNWVKLLTFPVFIISVIIGGEIAARSFNPYKILLLEGIILVLSGIISEVFIRAPGLTWETYVVVMMIVLAMGLQNAFGKLYAKETFGPTTMMTGNVTQASLDFIKVVTVKPFDVEVWGSLKKQLVLLSGFLLGCLFGAVLAAKVGLCAVTLPGFVLLFCFFKTNKLNSNT
jgi:uncharacterized membrane protein YoaK (UPF0700 family)